MSLLVGAANPILTPINAGWPLEGYKQKLYHSDPTDSWSGKNRQWPPGGGVCLGDGDCWVG